MTDPCLVVLDCDGTIVDSQSAIVDIMDQTFAAHGLAEPEATAVRRIIGLELGEAIARLAPGQSRSENDAIAESYRRIASRRYDEGGPGDSLFPGLRESIHAMNQAGWLLGVATGKSMRGLGVVYDTHDIGQYFVTSQTSDKAAGKPNPEMLLRAMNETGVGRQRTVMVGDTSYDMAMAVNAGTHAIGVGWGYHGADELREAGAQMIIEDYADLMAAVIELLGIET